MQVNSLPGEWSEKKIQLFLKGMFCSEAHYMVIQDDGFDFLMEWASLGLPFAKTDYPKILNEFCIQLKQNPLAFFHTFFRELLESDFSKEQKESLIYFMTFSINSLFQLYFSLLTHDYIFPERNSNCQLNFDLKMWETANIGSRFELIPTDLQLPEKPIFSVDKFVSYVIKISDHWMNNGEYNLKL